MTTPQQFLLDEIISAAKQCNCNLDKFELHDNIEVASIMIYHFENKKRLSLTIPYSLVNHSYLFKVFIPLNDIKNDNN